MSRSNGNGRRSGRRASAPTLFQQLLAIHAGGWVFTAGLYSVDGVTGKVGAQIDHLNIAHVRSQSVEERQVALPAPHADFGGQMCQAATGAQWYVDNGTAASWDWLTAGAPGVDIAATFSLTSVAANSTLLGTGTTGSNAGLSWFISAGGGSSTWSLRKAGGTSVSMLAMGSIATQPYIFQHRHAAAEDPDALCKKSGASAVTGNYASAAAAATPPGPYTIWGTPAGGFLSSARWHAEMGVPRILGAAERAVRHQWLELTGLTA